MGLAKTIEISPDETDGEDREISTYLTRVIKMSYARYAKDWSEAHCRNCYHTNEANADGSCSAYGYNGVDCQAQPCVCRNHAVTVHPKPLGLQEQEAKQP